MEKNILIVEDKEATLRMLEKLIKEDVGGVAVFLQGIMSQRSGKPF